MTGFEWPDDYNPALSMQTAMVEASAALKLTTGNMEVSLFVARLANADTWVRIAQVHATNMQTEAIKQLLTRSAGTQEWRVL